MSERSFQEDIDMEFAGMDEEPKDEHKSELEKRVDALELALGEIQFRLAFAGAPIPNYGPIKIDRCTCSEKGKTSAIITCPIHG